MLGLNPIRIRQPYGIGEYNGGYGNETNLQYCANNRAGRLRARKHCAYAAEVSGALGLGVFRPVDAFDAGAGAWRPRPRPRLGFPTRS